jgi:hypothetical protein
VAESGGHTEALEAKTVEYEREETIADDLKKAPPGFEPGMADLQSTALPLG